MNIVVFSHELPYPAIHGFRIDMFNRLRGFKKLGHKVFLIAWSQYPDNSQSENVAIIKDLVDSLACYNNKKGFLNRFLDIFKKVVNLPFQSSVVTQCSLSRAVSKDLSQSLRLFRGDVIFVESIYAAKLAFHFAKELRLPVYVRSHNIEHIYIRNHLIQASSIMLKLKYLAMYSNLKRYEMNTLTKADGYFDISSTDLEFWKKSGLDHGSWLPPVYHLDESIDDCLEIKYDIAYIGNLCMPNNIEAIFWFIKVALPIIKSNIQNIRILIAGSNPTKEVLQVCNENANVTLISNPKNVLMFYREAKVLINPIVIGSGVNIKTVELLHRAQNVVCTPKAVEGLPTGIEQVFHILERDQNFINRVIDIVKGKVEFVNLNQRQKYLHYYSLQFLEEKLSTMRPNSN